MPGSADRPTTPPAVPSGARTATTARSPSPVLRGRQASAATHSRRAANEAHAAISPVRSSRTVTNTPAGSAATPAPRKRKVKRSSATGDGTATAGSAAASPSSKPLSENGTDDTGSSWPTSPSPSDGGVDDEAQEDSSASSCPATPLFPPPSSGADDGDGDNEEETAPRAPLAVAPIPQSSTEENLAADGEAASPGDVAPRPGALAVPPFVIREEHKATFDARRAAVTTSMRRGARHIPATLCPPPLGEAMAPARLFPQGSGGPPDVDALTAHLSRLGQLHERDALRLIDGAAAVMDREPNLLRLPVAAPPLADGPASGSASAAITDDVVVVGDLHGQFFDLVKVLHLVRCEAEARWDSREQQRRRQNGHVDHGGDGDGATAGTRRRLPVLLFLGDYVDRGAFGCEVLALLCALKLRDPDRVFLLRGNHESRTTTQQFTFHDECVRKWSPAAFDRVVHLFERLPLAAVVGGRMFCVHGGLSPKVIDVSDIDLIDRRREIPSAGAFTDLMWADPTDDYDEPPSADMRDPHTGLEPADFFANDDRDCSYKFSFGAAETFLTHNAGLVCVVRAHQCQDDGYTLHRAARVGPDPADAARRAADRRRRRAARDEEAARAKKRRSGQVGLRRQLSSDGRRAGSVGLSRTASEAAGLAGTRASRTASATPSTTASRKLRRSGTASGGRASGGIGSARPAAAASLQAEDDPAWPPPFVETTFPSAISIFSAPNYCGYDNVGAFLTLADAVVGVPSGGPDSAVRAAVRRLPVPRLDITQFFSAPHPHELPGGLNGFAWSQAFLLDQVRSLVTAMLDGDSDSDGDGDAEAGAVTQSP